MRGICEIERVGWTWPTLVNDELIDIGFPNIRARSISWNNSSIPRFPKVGHEPFNPDIYTQEVLCDSSVMIERLFVSPL